MNSDESNPIFLKFFHINSFSFTGHKIFSNAVVHANKEIFVNNITITLGMVNEVNVVELMRNAVIDGVDAVIMGFKTFEEIEGKLDVGGRMHSPTNMDFEFTLMYCKKYTLKRLKDACRGCFTMYFCTWDRVTHCRCITIFTIRLVNCWGCPILVVEFVYPWLLVNTVRGICVWGGVVGWGVWPMCNN